MRELRFTKIDGKMYLFPVPVMKDRKYLIFCASENEAEKIILHVKQGKLTHPDLISEDFVYLTHHMDKQTKIFIPTIEAISKMSN